MKKLILSICLILPFVLGADPTGPIGKVSISQVTGLSTTLNGKEDLFTRSVDIYINGNRAANYTPDGTVNRPFRSISSALAINPTSAITIHLSPGNYTDSSPINFPAYPVTIYGNGATWTVPSVTVNAPYTIYNLNTVGNVIYAYTGTTRSLRVGGTLVGDVSISGFEDYESVNFSAHTVTVQAGANPLFSHCTFGSKLVSGASTSTITINDCQFSRSTVDDYNIDMAAGGNLVCRGALLDNKTYATGGTHANINLSGASTTTPSLLAGCICGNGISAGTAYVIFGDDNIAPVLTGTKIVPIKSPVLAFGVGGGTAQAQIATVPIVSYGYAAGMEITYIPTVSNTSSNPTININGLGNKTILSGVNSSLSSTLIAGDIVVGIPARLMYDGTYFRLMNPQGLISLTDSRYALSSALSNYTTTTLADSRYNLTANNVPYTNYTYKKSQTDSIAALKAGLASPTFTGATSLTTIGDIQCGGGFYVNGTTGAVQTYNTFKSAAATLNFNIGTSTAFSTKIANGGTDLKPSIWMQYGDATNKAVVVRSGNSGARLDRHTISSLQTMVTTADYYGTSSIIPLANSIYEVNDGTNHLFDVFSSIINTTVPMTSPNLIDGWATTATAGGTTTLTSLSAYQQYFTGTLAQTVVLPVITTLANGIQYSIVNTGTGTVTVQSSGLNTVVTLVGGTSAIVTCGDITQGTGAGAWSVSYSGLTVAAGKKATINNTITLAGTDASTYTFPTATKTLAANDGSNLTISGQVIGDIPIASSTTAYGKLADVATGSVLTSGGVGVAPAWSASPAMTAPTIATTAAIGATTSAINGSWARLYTQPMYATPTVLTAAATITWTPTIGTNIYTLTPTSATTINMGTVPAGCVGSEVLLAITTSGTSGYVVTFGTNLKSQGVLTTTTTSGLTYYLKFIIMSTTLVAEQGARPVAE